MMLHSLILICAAAVAQPDCAAETAAVVVQGPDVASLATCGLHGQAYLAHTALAGYLQEGHYLKISCQPERPISNVLGIQGDRGGRVADNRLVDPLQR
jgi:hypothetical protein